MKIAENSLLPSIGAYMPITTDAEMANRMLTYYYLISGNGRVGLSLVIGGCTTKIDRFRYRAFKRV